MSKESIKCPFCHSESIEPVVGNNICPVCEAEFKMDDRLECIFIDVNKPILPIEGTVCIKCGLVQHELSRKCLFCGAKLSWMEQ